MLRIEPLTAADYLGCGNQLRGLEIACGSAHFSASMIARGWWMDSRDITKGSAYDMKQESYYLWVKGGLQRGIWQYVHLGTCCTTWSIASA